VEGRGLLTSAVSIDLDHDQAELSMNRASFVGINGRALQLNMLGKVDMHHLSIANVTGAVDGTALTIGQGADVQLDHFRLENIENTAIDLSRTPALHFGDVFRAKLMLDDGVISSAAIGV